MRGKMPHSSFATFLVAKLLDPPGKLAIASHSRDRNRLPYSTTFVLGPKWNPLVPRRDLRRQDLLIPY